MTGLIFNESEIYFEYADSVYGHTGVCRGAA